MLGYIYEETTKYMKNEGKDVRKKKGQFFTPVNIAAYMPLRTAATFFGNRRRANLQD